MSRNDNKGIANMQSTQTNKAKHRVIPIKEESTMKKRSIGYHENSVSLGKLRKKIKIEKKEKRQQEGIQAKKARGEWEDYGRPRAQKPANWDEVITTLDREKTAP